jgi:hypothetical protein
MGAIERLIDCPYALERMSSAIECTRDNYINYCLFIIFERRYVIILLGLGFWESLIHVLIGLGVLGLYIHAYSLQKR